MKLLYSAKVDLEGAPIVSFTYATRNYAEEFLLNDDLRALLDRMCEGIEQPRVTYRCRVLAPGGVFSNPGWHTDGLGTSTEVHRLFTLGGPATEGRGGLFLSPGFVWEFPGDFSHRPQGSPGGKRLMLRVSKSLIRYRNYQDPERY